MYVASLTVVCSGCRRTCGASRFTTFTSKITCAQVTYRGLQPVHFAVEFGEGLADMQDEILLDVLDLLEGALYLHGEVVELLLQGGELLVKVVHGGIASDLGGIAGDLGLELADLRRGVALDGLDRVHELVEVVLHLGLELREVRHDRLEAFASLLTDRLDALASLLPELLHHLLSYEIRFDDPPIRANRVDVVLDLGHLEVGRLLLSLQGANLSDAEPP